MIRQIFENGEDRLSCKRVCAMLFCISAIILSFLKYDFDTICLLAGSCISLLGAGLIETRNIRTNTCSNSDFKSNNKLQSVSDK